MLFSLKILKKTQLSIAAIGIYIIAGGFKANAEDKCKKLLLSAYITLAEQLIAKQAENFEQHWILNASSNKLDYSATVQAIENFFSKNAEEPNQLISLLNNKNNYAFTLRQSSEVREKVMETGFQNLRTTNSTSSATLDVSIRNRLESKRLFLTEKEYATWNPQITPKTGYIRIINSEPAISNWLFDHNSQRYGDDLYVLKKDDIWNRTTFIIGDSLSENSNAKFAPLSWLYPALMMSLEVDHLQRYAIKDLRKELSSVFKENPANMNTIGKRVENNYYVEFQTFGPVDFGNVEEFIFTKYPPTGNFLKILLQKKIKIRDGRESLKNPIFELGDYSLAKDWNP